MPSSTRLVSSLFRYQSTTSLNVALIPICMTARPHFTHRPLQPFQQIRTKYVKKRGADWSTALTQGSGADITSQLSLQPETQREIALAGLDTAATVELLYQVVIRARSEFKVDLVYEVFKNYGQWKRDPTSVPVRFQKPIHYYIGDKETDDWGIHKTQLDTLPPHKVGEALLILARQNLRMATYIYEFDGFIDPVRMTLAMFLLEIAIRYSNTDAAILLINIAEDPAVKFWNEQLGRLGEKIVMPNIGSAKGLIRESVTKNPSECSWQTIVTYMRDEYRDSNIMRQTPNQLAWAIGLLRLTVENLEPRHVLQAEPAYARREGTISLKFFNWLECENPWRVLRRVVIHSLRIKAGLPSYPTPELQSLLKQCLSELVRYNDPNASFTVAIRDHVLGTEQWETLMKSAAAHGIADANWLMAALYLTKTKFLGQKKIFLQLDTERMISLAQDYASIAAQFSLAEAPIEQTLPGREYVSVNRILAHTALVKTVDGYEAGRETLEMYLEEVRDTPGLALRLIRRVEKHYEDYLQVDKISEERWGWSKERCLNMIRDGFGVDQTYQTAKRGGDYWGIST